MQKWPPVYDAGYHPEPGQDYWFPDIETMDPEEREQTIILPKPQQQLKYAYAHSGLYQKKRFAHHRANDGTRLTGANRIQGQAHR